jgi:outer membrane protein assembly factor BamB
MHFFGAGLLMRMHWNRRFKKLFDPLPRVVLVAACILPGTWTNPARAEDWPQWRGPHRDGVWAETGVLETFPAEGLKVRWRNPVGFGWSSPVVSQGRVFVTDSLLARTAAQERVHCFDEATGKSLWTNAYDVVYPEWAFTAGQEGRPGATPIVDAGKIYALGGNGHVHCLEAPTGKVLWEKRLEKEYEIQVLSCRTSPLIEGDLLILFTGGKPGACVTALDKNSGKQIWRALDESISNSSPIVITAGGKRQLIVWTGESVTSLAPATGEVYWRERLVTSNNDAIATPVSEKNLLLLSGLMLELRVEEPLATTLWPTSRAVSRRVLSNTSTPLLRGDHLYSAKSSGELVCLEARTGQQLWETDKVTGLKSGASIHLTANGDSVFLFTDEGVLIRARLTPQGYQELSRARLLEPTVPFGGKMLAWVAPAYANRHVFARSDRELVCASLAANP